METAPVQIGSGLGPPSTSEPAKSQVESRVMAKQKKSKPDFSKPKPVKINIEEERIEEKSAETERKAKAASDEFGQIDKNATEELTFTKEKMYLNLPLVVIAGRH